MMKSDCQYIVLNRLGWVNRNVAVIQHNTRIMAELLNSGYNSNKFNKE